jgi:Zn/Cd-binding protein ZinT
VNIVEYPSGRNGFRFVFEINDTDGGADNYEVEVVW